MIKRWLLLLLLKLLDKFLNKVLFAKYFTKLNMLN
jgi:hypothetical protein